MSTHNSRIQDNSEIFCKLTNAKTSGLLWPKIRLASFVFSLSRYPNTLYVKHSNGTYLGKIVGFKLYPVNTWLITAEDKAEIVHLVSSSLSSSLRAHGRITGECGMCGRTLVDPVSIYNAIGPICAGKFGVMLAPVPFESTDLGI